MSKKTELIDVTVRVSDGNITVRERENTFEGDLMIEEGHVRTHVVSNTKNESKLVKDIVKAVKGK